jgi:type IV secretion system protein VirD4
MRRGYWIAGLWLTAAAGVAWGWLAAASYIYLWGVGRLFLFRFPYHQWLIIAPYWRLSWWVQTWVVAGAAAPTLLLLVCAAGLVRHWWKQRQHPFSRPPGGRLVPLERGVTDNHGHAAWATRQDLTDRFKGPGCLIGAVERGGRLLFDDVTRGPTHSLQIAGPGSGKSTTAINRVWHWDGPCVVFDPACEIGPIMADALRARGRTVHTIDLAGSGMNILDWIDVNHPESDTHIRSVVDWIYNENATANVQTASRDPYWATQGRALVTCLLAHLLHNAPAGLDPTLAALRRGIAIPEEDIQDTMRFIHANSRSRMAAELAGGFMGMRAKETFSSIYGNAFAATEWLSVEAYADAVSGSSLRTADILQSGTVLFVQIPLRTLLTTPAIGRAVMGALFNAMFHADTGQGDRILYQIDEAWLLGPMKEIKLCHTTARKYRGTLASIWQSEGQLEEVWGKDGAKLMRDTVSWRSYNAVQDGDVAEKLSRDIGEHAVMATSEGDNSGRQKPWGLALPSQSRGKNTNVHEIKRRLIKSDEILRAPADEMFVLARDFPNPIQCYSAPYFQYPAVARQMQRSRFVQSAAE